jgi:hypothetical protein
MCELPENFVPLLPGLLSARYWTGTTRISATFYGTRAELEDRCVMLLTSGQRRYYVSCCSCRCLYKLHCGQTTRVVNEKRSPTDGRLHVWGHFEKRGDNVGDINVHGSSHHELFEAPGNQDV